MSARIYTKALEYQSEYEKPLTQTPFYNFNNQIKNSATIAKLSTQQLTNYDIKLLLDATEVDASRIKYVNKLDLSMVADSDFIDRLLINCPYLEELILPLEYFYSTYKKTWRNNIPFNLFLSKTKYTEEEKDEKIGYNYLFFYPRQLKKITVIYNDIFDETYDIGSNKNENLLSFIFFSLLKLNTINFEFIFEYLNLGSIGKKEKKNILFKSFSQLPKQMSDRILNFPHIQQNVSMHFSHGINTKFSIENIFNDKHIICSNKLSIFSKMEKDFEFKFHSLFQCREIHSNVDIAFGIYEYFEDHVYVPNDLFPRNNFIEVINLTNAHYLKSNRTIFDKLISLKCANTTVYLTKSDKENLRREKKLYNIGSFFPKLENLTIDFFSLVSNYYPMGKTAKYYGYDIFESIPPPKLKKLSFDIRKHSFSTGRDDVRIMQNNLVRLGSYCDIELIQIIGDKTYPIFVIDQNNIPTTFNEFPVNYFSGFFEEIFKSGFFDNTLLGLISENKKCEDEFFHPSIYITIPIPNITEIINSDVYYNLPDNEINEYSLKTTSEKFHYVSRKLDNVDNFDYLAEFGYPQNDKIFSIVCSTIRNSRTLFYVPINYFAKKNYYVFDGVESIISSVGKIDVPENKFLTELFFYNIFLEKNLFVVSNMKNVKTLSFSRVDFEADFRFDFSSQESIETLKMKEIIIDENFFQGNFGNIKNFLFENIFDSNSFSLLFEECKFKDLFFEDCIFIFNSHTKITSRLKKTIKNICDKNNWILTFPKNNIIQIFNKKK